METCKLSQRSINMVMNFLEERNFDPEERKHIFDALNAHEWYEGEREMGVYKFDVDCGRMGNLNGTFTAKKKDVEWLLNCEYEVYFGEVLGKHSEVYFGIREEHLKLISDDPKEVKNCRDSGYNPFDYRLLGGKQAWGDLTINEIIELEERNLLP